MKVLFSILAFLLFLVYAHAEDGYDLWLRYRLIDNPERLRAYQHNLRGWMVANSSPTAEIAKKELALGLTAMLGQPVEEVREVKGNGILIAGTFKSPAKLFAHLRQTYPDLGDEGFVIVTSKYADQDVILIAAEDDRGMLYGVFHFLRLLQTHQSINKLEIQSRPRTKLRILNHWDNRGWHS